MKDVKTFRVFIASPDDVKKARDMLCKVIERLNKPDSPLAGEDCKLEILDWRNAAPASGKPQPVILDQFPVSSWDIFIGILWMRFGTPTGDIDPSTGRCYESGTEEEFKKAYESCEKTTRPRILIYRCTKKATPDKIDQEQKEKVDVFFKNISSGGTHPCLHQEYDKNRKFEERVQRDLISTVRALRKTPIMPPPPPKYFIGRQELLEELKEGLCRSESMAIFGLHGMGKSAIVLAIAADQKVREFFTGGILWAPLGKNPEVLAILGNCAAAMGIRLNKIADVKTVEGRKRAILETIGEDPVLIIIDDAREVDEAKAFKIECPKCAHILTTRYRHVAASFASNQAIAISGLDEEDSLKLLDICAPGVVGRVLDKAKRLVRAVSGLPLSIILLGERLRKSVGGSTVYRIENELEQILEREELLLDEVIGDSYKALNKKARVILQYLSIFPPEPNSFSEEAALAVAGKTRKHIKDLDPIIDFRLVEIKDFKNSSRLMLNTAIYYYVKRKRTRSVVNSASKRMVDYFVSYVQKNEKEYDALQLENRNIMRALEIAHTLKMKEALLKGVNAFSNFLIKSGLYELAESQLKRAEEAGRDLKDEKMLTVTLLNLGAVAYFRSSYDMAEKYYGESNKLAEKNNEQISIIDSLKGLGEVAAIYGESEKTEVYFKRALDKAREINDEGRIIELLTCLGAMEDIHGNYPDAIDYFHEGIKIKADDILNDSNLYANLGWVAAHIGDFDQAREYWREGLKLAEQINHKGNICFLNSNLGWVEDRWGNYEKAAEHFKTGIKIARETGNLNMIGVLLTNMGAAQIHHGDYQKAAEHLNEGLDVVRDSGHVERKGVLLENLAIVDARLGRCEDAEQHLKEGLEVAEKGRINERICAIYTYMGELAIQCEDYSEAGRCLRQGLKLARKIVNPERLGVVYLNQGVLADKQRESVKAEQHLNNALVQTEIIDYRWLISMIHSALGEHYCSKTDYNKASREFDIALKIGKKIKSKDMIAAAQFGLAGIAWAKGDIRAALGFGVKSLNIYEEIGHYKGKDVERWLDRLLPINNNRMPK